MEAKNGIKIVTPYQDFMHTIENAIHFGLPGFLSIAIFLLTNLSTN